MNLTLWIIAGALAAGFLAGGLSLTLLPRERYRTLGPSQCWVDDFSDRHLKAIGTIKIIGSLGLVIPAVLGVVPVLTPIAACGLVLFMAGAGTTRFRRSEWKLLAGDLVFLSLFAFLALGRFELHPL